MENIHFRETGDTWFTDRYSVPATAEMFNKTAGAGEEGNEGKRGRRGQVAENVVKKDKWGGWDDDLLSWDDKQACPGLLSSRVFFLINIKSV